jgi:hypothetical protein
MTDKNLGKKLLIKPGQKVAIVNAASGYPAGIGELPQGVTLIDKLDAPVDFVLLFAQTSKDIERLVPLALKVLKPDGMFWAAYPKGTSKVRTDLNRDILWNLVGKYRLTGVAMVSIDEVWSAMRLRPKDKVGK